MQDDVGTISYQAPSTMLDSIPKEPSSEMFVAIAIDDCVCFYNDRRKLLRLKRRLEKLFILALQEGNILRFLNLWIIQSPRGISIDQTDHIMETVIGPYFQDRDTTKMLTITSPFPADSSFETKLYDSPILTGSALHKLENKYDGSLFHWNGIILHITITTRVDMGHAIMRLSGYLASPNEAIFEALDQTMRYLYFYCHIPSMYPHRPLGKKALAMHWAKDTVEYLAPEYGTSIINSADADHARDIRERRSVSSSLHLLNGVLIEWKCKTQSTSALHSTCPEIISLSEGVKTTGHIHDFGSSVGYPFREGTTTLEDNQGTIKTAESSRLHTNTRHLTTRISWLNEQYTMDII
jgi:hypothetical protein